MFKSLKRKFIITSMTLFVSIIILICGSIYLVTKGNSERVIFMQLSESLNTIRMIEPRNRPPYDRDTILIEYNIKESKVLYRSENNMDDSDINNVIDEVLNNKKDKGFIESNDYNLAYVYRVIPIGVEIALRDNTIYQKTMRKLVISSIVIGAFSIFLAYLISLYIANKAVKPVEEAYNSQKRFIADASHELKTPLAVVKTNLEILKANRYESVESQEKWIEYISFQTDRMSKLVNDLLYLAKADNNEVLGEKSEFNISDVIMNQLLSFEAIVYENSLSLDYDIQDEIKFFGNREGVNQVVGILLDNAIKHSYKNKDIIAKLVENKGVITFSVTNYGDTISKEDLDRIFDRFYRIDKSRSREKGGHGLGLSIAKTIVEKEGGNIKVISENNITSFIVAVNSVI